MIRIGFGTENSIKGRLIRWATNSQWSHVWIEYKAEPWGTVWVIHSSYDGVVSVPVDRVYKKYPKRRIYRCSQDKLPGSFKWAEERVTALYDFAVIWNALLLVLYRWTKWKSLYSIVARNAARYTCSEFVAAFLKTSNLLTPQADPELMTPGDLEYFCARSGDFTPE